jgi:hypothetical protein
MIELVEICIEPGPTDAKCSFCPGQLALTAVPACARQSAASAAPPQLQPQAGTPMWSSLDGHLLGRIMTHLEEAEGLAAAHMVSKEWRYAARLATRVLAFRGAVPPDFARIQAANFPNVSAVRLSGMHVKTQTLSCIAGLEVTKLQFRHVIEFNFWRETPHLHVAWLPQASAAFLCHLQLCLLML